MNAPSPRKGAKFWALADQAIQSATNFATMVFAARTLPIDDFARFSLAYLAILFVASLHRTWITQPMNVLGAKAPESLKARVGALWVGHSGLIPAGALLLVPLSFLGFSDRYLVAASMLYVAAYFLQEMSRRYAYTRFQINHAVSITSVISAVQLLGLLGLVSRGQVNPAIWMLMLGLSQLCGAAVGAIFSDLRGTIRSRGSMRQVLVEQLRHSRWVIASQLVFWLSSQMYPFLVVGVGVSQAASFNAGMSILNAANVPRLTLANFLPAQAGRIRAQGGDAALCRYTRKTLLRLTLAGAVAWPIVYLLADHVVHLFYGDKFPGAADVLRWVSLGVWASVVSVVLNSAALALDTTRNIFVSNAMGAVFSLSAGAYLTNRFGLSGAIFGNVLGYAIPAAWQLVHLWPRLRQSS